MKPRVFPIFIIILIYILSACTSRSKLNDISKETMESTQIEAQLVKNDKEELEDYQKAHMIDDEIRVNDVNALATARLPKANPGIVITYYENTDKIGDTIAIITFGNLGERIAVDNELWCDVKEFAESFNNECSDGNMLKRCQFEDLVYTFEFSNGKIITFDLYYKLYLADLQK